MDKGDKVKIYEKMAIFDQNKVPENYTKNWPATCKKKFLAAMPWVCPISHLAVPPTPPPIFAQFNWAKLKSLKSGFDPNIYIFSESSRQADQKYAIKIGENWQKLVKIGENW